MKNFVAIDFETANQHRSSICSAGLVVVREGKVTYKAYRLVRPTPNFYCEWATEIHGLSNEDTCEEPEFPEVWAELAPLMVDLPLVAHNSPFDEGCLRAAHQAHGMRYPNYQFCCTYAATRQAFPLLQNHQLHTVAAHVGFDLQKHHHALADAEACAEIAVKIL